MRCPGTTLRKENTKSTETLIVHTEIQPPNQMANQIPVSEVETFKFAEFSKHLSNPKNSPLKKKRILDRK